MQFNTSPSTSTTITDITSPSVSCLIFCEAENHLLFVQKKGASQEILWGLPQGIIQKNEAPLTAAIRIFKNQTSLDISPNQLKGWGISQVDGEAVRFFSLKFDTQPSLSESSQWISIFAVKILDDFGADLKLTADQQEAFAHIFRDRFWQRVDSPVPSADPAQIQFCKGDQTLVFDEKRKLGITFIGKPHSGKATQAALVSKALGMTYVSDGAIFQDEPQEPNSPLINLVEVYGKKFPTRPLPVEVPLGMIAKRLSKTDCIPGFVLAGFPSTEEQSSVLLKIYTRKQDTFLPFHLALSDADVQARFTEDTQGCELRLSEFNQAKPMLIDLLSKRSAIHTLTLTSADTPLNIFHRISLTVQDKLEEIAQEQERSLASHQNVQRALNAQRKSSAVQLALFGTIAVGVVFTAGFVLGKSSK